MLFPLPRIRTPSISGSCKDVLRNNNNSVLLPFPPLPRSSLQRIKSQHAPSRSSQAHRQPSSCSVHSPVTVRTLHISFPPTVSLDFHPFIPSSHLHQYLCSYIQPHTSRDELFSCYSDFSGLLKMLHSSWVAKGILAYHGLWKAFSCLTSRLISRGLGFNRPHDITDPALL